MINRSGLHRIPWLTAKRRKKGLMLTPRRTSFHVIEPRTV
jgi:hypothetical protein